MSFCFCSTFFASSRALSAFTLPSLAIASRFSFFMSSIACLNNAFSFIVSSGRSFRSFWYFSLTALGFFWSTPVKTALQLPGILGLFCLGDTRRAEGASLDALATCCLRVPIALFKAATYSARPFRTAPSLRFLYSRSTLPVVFPGMSTSGGTLDNDENFLPF
ncbi:hypothetical protein ATCV1_z796R [Acanthocystis turfacea chlorella virus 1]|uniref:Uncharacterized protein z796R n=1 Tax=Chlorovirus heliozoae TaxID=322019 RepID=A7KA56_9PHYC|nr:hypothetical protein ATCV1_z796R [Acanthocystis turfacea chlorella virus 1]ABT16930.1 hypothetical protein ATCV1_z796R [Acanthocystis turfacea chlorella virus 1]